MDRQTDYRPPFFLFNGHLQTIYPTLFRKVARMADVHERITTPDDDFLDLYWTFQGSRSLVIISHGLEGNAQRHYMKGMARACHLAGLDTLRWNFRGCGAELNRQRRFYHSGATDDLDVVVDCALTKGYDAIYLVGFSLGGNLTLKYLGESERPQQIKRAVALSVPLDLLSSCYQISSPSNRLYANRFLRSLKNKILRKATVRNDINTAGLSGINNLIEFDDRYTAPLHGFEDAVDYYRQCSAIRFIESISIPTLIINAANDPFLSEACYPDHIGDHSFVRFESPVHGGHVGFTQFSKNGLYWSEERTVAFLTQHTGDDRAL